MVPQLEILVPGTTRKMHPDVGDAVLKIAIEAESFEWHGESAQLTRDCRRYNELSLLGWHVIRFSWWQVMHDPTYVQRVLVEAAAVAAALTQHANVA